MKITEPCGCERTKVSEGTPFEGWLRKYCDAHNPYKNMAPRIEA